MFVFSVYIAYSLTVFDYFAKIVKNKVTESGTSSVPQLVLNCTERINNMEIKLQKENQKLTVTVCGRLNSSTVPELEVLLKENMEDTKEIVFDFHNLEYISSAGLRVLLASYKKLAGKVKILGANSTVTDIFKITGMAAIFDVD